MGKPILTLKSIVKRFGAFIALKGVDLEVGEGEFVTRSERMRKVDALADGRRFRGAGRRRRSP